MQNQDQWMQRRVFLFSHPRTASNLLIRMLSGQSGWQITTYHFLERFQFLRETLDDTKAKDITDVEADVRMRCDSLSQQAREKLQQSLDVAVREVPPLASG